MDARSQLLFFFAVFGATFFALVGAVALFIYGGMLLNV